jgi:hypothetical protein
MKRAFEKNPRDPKQTDYVPFGSEQHMGLLGLRKAEKGDDPAIVHDGFTFADVSVFGPMTSERWLRVTLVGKVNELKTRPTVPADAPSMFTPVHSEADEVHGII